MINKLFLLSFCAVFLFASASISQEETSSRSVIGTQEAEDAKLIINQVDTSQYPKVTVFTTVLKNGIPLKGLTSSDFEIREDEVPQEPLVVVPKLSPLSIILVMDTSGSMYKVIKEAQDAGLEFLNTLEDQDTVAVVGFSTAISALSPFTKDKELAKKAVQSTVARGNTALYDAVYESLDSIKTREGRKAILILSDGYDDDGTNPKQPKQLSKRSVTEVVNLAKEVSSPIFVVGLGNQIDEKTLNMFASESGGTYLNAATAENLKEVYSKIGEQLSGQYNIYYTSNLPADGATHRVVLTSGDLSSFKDFISPASKDGVNTDNKHSLSNLTQEESKEVVAVDSVSELTEIVEDAPVTSINETQDELMVGSNNLLSKKKGGQIVAANKLGLDKVQDDGFGKIDNFKIYKEENTEIILAFDQERLAELEKISFLIQPTADVPQFEVYVSTGNSPWQGYRSVGVTNLKKTASEKAEFQTFPMNNTQARYVKLMRHFPVGLPRADAKLSRIDIFGKLVETRKQTGENKADMDTGFSVFEGEDNYINVINTNNGANIVSDPAKGNYDSNSIKRGFDEDTGSFGGHFKRVHSQDPYVTFEFKDKRFASIDRLDFCLKVIGQKIEWIDVYISDENDEAKFKKIGRVKPHPLVEYKDCHQEFPFGKKYKAKYAKLVFGPGHHNVTSVRLMGTLDEKSEDKLGVETE